MKNKIFISDMGGADAFREGDSGILGYIWTSAS